MKIFLLTDHETNILLWALQERFLKINDGAAAVMTDPYINSDLIPFYKKRLSQTLKLIFKLQNKDYDPQNVFKIFRPDPIEQLQPQRSEQRDDVIARPARQTPITETPSQTESIAMAAYYNPGILQGQ